MTDNLLTFTAQLKALATLSRGDLMMLKISGMGDRATWARWASNPINAFLTLPPEEKAKIWPAIDMGGRR